MKGMEAVLTSELDKHGIAALSWCPYNTAVQLKQVFLKLT